MNVRVYSEIDKKADADRLAQAIKNTKASQVIAAYKGMTEGAVASEVDIDTLIHALVVAVGVNNEKLGGHCVVSKKDVLALL